MSLILEALKKSEAQRRLGEMPNLGTPVTATRRRRSPLPWLAAALVLALGAAGGWRYLRQHAAPAAATGEPAPIGTAMKATTTPAAATAQRQPSPKPVTPATAPAPQVAPAAATPAPAPKKEVAPPPPPTAHASAPATAPVAAPAPALPASTPALPPPAPPAAAARAPAPAANDVPTVDEMPADVRSALPALPITMQVYSPDPKRRFAIIEGARVSEGDSVRGVTVVEIRPSGLVLEFHGRRMLMPRPGS